MKYVSKLTACLVFTCAAVLPTIASAIVAPLNIIEAPRYPAPTGNECERTGITIPETGPIVVRNNYGGSTLLMVQCRDIILALGRPVVLGGETSGRRRRFCSRFQSVVPSPMRFLLSTHHDTNSLANYRKEILPASSTWVPATARHKILPTTGTTDSSHLFKGPSWHSSMCLYAPITAKVAVDTLLRGST